MLFRLPPPQVDPRFLWKNIIKNSACPVLYCTWWVCRQFSQNKSIPWYLLNSLPHKTEKIHKATEGKKQPRLGHLGRKKVSGTEGTTRIETMHG
jgi:hypothetical protein